MRLGTSFFSRAPLVASLTLGALLLRCGTEFHACEGDDCPPDGSADSAGGSSGEATSTASGGATNPTSGGTSGTSGTVGEAGSAASSDGGTGGGSESTTGEAGSASATSGLGGSQSQADGGAAGAWEQEDPPTPLTIKLLPGVRDPARIPAPADLLVSDSDGNYVTHLSADAEGQATIDDFPKGGSVTTLVRYSGGESYLTTYVGLSSRKELLLPGYLPSPPRVSGEMMTVTVNATADVGDTLKIGVGAEQSSKVGPSATFTAEIDCGSYPSYDVRVASMSGSELVRWNELLDQPCTPNAEVTQELEAGRTSYSEFVIHVRPIPLGSYRLDGRVFLYRHNPTWDEKRIISPPAVEETIVLRVPAGDAEWKSLSGIFSAAEGYPVDGGRFQRQGPAVPNTLTWNPDRGLARFADPGSVDTTDLLRPEVAFTLKDDAPLGDVITTHLAFSGSTFVRWTGWLPAKRSGIVRVPEIPAELRAVYLPGVESVFGPYLSHYDYILVEDYPELIDRMTEAGVTDNYDMTDAGLR